MAFLHCHTPDCGWSQDDFWDETGKGYTPFRQDIVDWWRESLFKYKVYLDKYLCEEIDQINGRHGPTRYDVETTGPDSGIKHHYVSGTDLVAAELTRQAQSIRNMNVKTEAEWKKIRETWVCPWCGQHNPDID